jgi:hypothetical protein
MKIKNSKFKQFEQFLFVFVIVLNAFPIISQKFFPTLDGPAHLYNSNLLSEILFHKNQIIREYYSFNPQILPNWTGHAFLSISNLVFPAYISEKLFLLFYIIALPLSFRSLIKAISPNNYLLSYLIFPFSHSFVFFLGFYNFCIALVFLFIALTFWVKNHDKGNATTRTLKLGSLIFLIYFSHIFVFVLALFLMGIYLAVDSIRRIGFEESSIKSRVMDFLNHSIVLILASSIPLSLFIYYFIYDPSYVGSNIFIDQKELLEWLKNIRPIISFNFADEETYTKKILYLILALFVIIVFIRVNALLSAFEIKNWREHFRALKLFFNVKDVWLLSAILVLVLYFKLPDSDGFAGFFSIRLGLIFFLLVIVWIAIQDLPKWLSIFSIVVIIFSNIRLNQYYSGVIKDLNIAAVAANNASELIEPNSVVLPMNYSDNWLVNHFSNYLGIDKPMIILENYEATSGFFPLEWDKNKLPNIMLDSASNIKYSCNTWTSNINGQVRKVDYVFIIGDASSKNDSCTNLVNQNIVNNFNLIYDISNCKLYKYKGLN